MDYNIDEIIAELKKSVRECDDLTMRLIKARGNHDKEAEMKTLLAMSSQVLSDEQNISFLIGFLKELKSKLIINE